MRLVFYQIAQLTLYMDSMELLITGRGMFFQDQFCSGRAMMMMESLYQRGTQEYKQQEYGPNPGE